MAIVIALFADATRLQEALDRLDTEGFGDEIVREDPEDGSTTALRESDLGLAPGANQAGALAELEPSSDLERFDLTEDEHEFLQRAMARGAEMVAVDTDRPDVLVALFEELNAQQIRRPA